MSIIQDYAEAAVIERPEDNSNNSEQPTARISFGTFILRVPDTRDN